jgi:hypothetical protein
MRYINTVPNRYKEGETVCAKANPLVELVIRRYVDRIYYCKIKADPDHKELVYFDRELISANENHDAGNNREILPQKD